jgi:hypothetical protein
VQLVGVFEGLRRGVGFHLADDDVLTDERKEQQLDVEALAVAMFPGRADFLPKASVGVRSLGDRVEFVRRLVSGSGRLGEPDANFVRWPGRHRQAAVRLADWLKHSPRDLLCTDRPAGEWR